MAKILIVCNYDFAFNKYMIPFANKLLDMGHEVGVACDGNNFSYDKISSKVSFYNLSMPRKISLVGFFSTTLSLRKIIKNNNYTLVNSNNRNASFIARIAMITLFFSKTKSIYTARGMYFHDSQGFFSYYTTYWVEVFLIFFTDIVLSQSKQDVKKLSSNPLVNSAKLNTIHNGIDTEVFSIKNVKKINLNIEGFIVCTIGRIVKEKGIIDLLNSFSLFAKDHSDASLLIIGGVLHDEHNEVLEYFWELAGQLKIKDKILVTGMIDNVEDFLAKADVYIHPSYREGVPRAVLEAMSLEKIVIASNIRGASEIINTKDIGILYEKGNNEQLVSAIKTVSEFSTKERRKMGLMARNRILELYTEESYVKRQVDAISKLF